MRLYLMFVTAVYMLFLIKLRWPKKKNILFVLQAISANQLWDTLPLWCNVNNMAFTLKIAVCLMLTVLF